MRDYARNIFRFGYRNDDVCFFAWIYEMKQFKVKVGRSFALISNQWAISFVCYWAKPFLLSDRLLSFNNVMITQTSARWSARIVELASGSTQEDPSLSLGGNVHRILLQKEPIFTKFQENTHNEGKQILNFSYLVIFPVLGRWHFRALIPILSTFNTRNGFKHCK